MKIIMTFVAGMFVNMVIMFLPVARAVTGYNISFDSVTGAFGTVVGGISLVFGTYFAYAAIEAFSHLKAIQKAREDIEIQNRAIERELNELLRRKISLERSILNAVDAIFTSLFSLSGNISTDDENQKLRKSRAINSLYLRRAILLLGIDDLDNEIYKTNILYIANNGNFECIPVLNSLCERISDQEILEYIRNAKISISER